MISQVENKKLTSTLERDIRQNYYLQPIVYLGLQKMCLVIQHVLIIYTHLLTCLIIVGCHVSRILLLIFSTLIIGWFFNKQFLIMLYYCDLQYDFSFGLIFELSLLSINFIIKKNV